jgi:3-oxoacyl-[acyl-carrier protein] reductase
VDRRAALITGAASGQGADLAIALAADGYGVALLDVDEDGLRETGETIEEAGGEALVLPTDVARRPAVVAAVAAAEERFGRLWLAAAVAGVAEGGFAVDAGDDHVHRVMSINYFGVVNVCTVAAASMIRGVAGGRLLVWSSVTAQYGGAGFSVYAASKSAVEGYSRALALELAPHRITVNVLRPGSIRTPMMASFDDEAAAAEAARIPLGRWGTPADLTAAARFLASDDAAWITGSTLTVDGGASAAAGSASLDGARHRLALESQRP